jgi:methionyl aminopeptidase
MSGAITRPGPNQLCHCGSGRKYKRCHQHLDLLADVAGTPSTGSVQPGTVSPRRPVPPGIPLPDYVADGVPQARPPRSVIKGPPAIAGMRAACAAARRVLDRTLAAVAIGVTTDALDAIAHDACLAEGGYPSCLGYHGYPKSICTSINEVICHGIPDSRPLADGDIINVDVTIFLGGFHGDCSETVMVGTPDAESARLIEVTRECLLRGIGAAGPGVRICEIGRVIERHATAYGYGVVRKFIGHGIGEQFHMDPQVPHYYDRRATGILQPGMTFTIEPMINLGSWRHRMWDDGWTAVTEDLRRSAQFEHTVLITATGVEILTLPAGLPQPFPG